jgi:tRNA dimethylallyltransferase
VIALDLPRETLAARVTARTHAMIEAGWVDEVRGLVARWGTAIRPLGSVGYRQILEHLQDARPLEAVEREIAKATLVYTRRQRTWLRNDADVAWRTHAEELLSPDGRRRVTAACQAL